MKTQLNLPALASSLVMATVYAVQPAVAAGAGIHIDRQDWSFSGPFGQFDQGQLQRGFQVYKGVCAGCHSLNRVRFRNLVEKGGPAFPEQDIKDMAAAWDHQMDAGPNDDGEMLNEDGEFFTRPPLLSDAIPGPYKNARQASAANGGALPPDLSLMAKARTTEYTGSVWYHPIHMMKDIATAYQEGGADYIYALLTGYRDKAPGYKLNDKGKLIALTDASQAGAEIKHCSSVTHGKGDDKPDVCNELPGGMSYNVAFPGHQIAMARPLSDDILDYRTDKSGKPVVPQTTEQYARDVAAFLSWAADPSHDQRKRTGWLVLLYLLITTVLLYFAKKSIWKRVKH